MQEKGIGTEGLRFSLQLLFIVSYRTKHFRIHIVPALNITICSQIRITLLFDEENLPYNPPNACESEHGKWEGILPDLRNIFPTAMECYKLRGWHPNIEGLIPTEHICLQLGREHP